MNNFSRFRFYVDGIINDSEQISFMIENYTNDLNFKIIESLTMPLSLSHKPNKCLTFFSSLDKTSKEFKMHVDNIVLVIIGSNDWFPIGDLFYIYFAIHSTNCLPDKDTFQGIYNRLNNRIEYNELTTELLGKGYDTDCYEYDLDDHFNMRSDCLTYCIRNFIGEMCNLDGILHSKKLYHEEILVRNSMRSKKINLQNYTCQQDMNILAESKCKKECKNDCVFRHYTYSEFEDQRKIHPYFLYLYIKHNTFPDVYIQYLPQTTFISFICYFAGLLGMWLGLSILSFLESVNIFSINIYHNDIINIPSIFRNISSSSYLGISLIIHQLKRFKFH